MPPPRRACPCLALYAVALLLLLLALVAPNARRETPLDPLAQDPSNPHPALSHHPRHLHDSLLDPRSSADPLDSFEPLEPPATLDPLDPLDPASLPPLPYSVPLDAGGRARLEWSVDPAEPGHRGDPGDPRRLTLRVAVSPWRHGLLLGLSERGRFEGAEFAAWWEERGGGSNFACAWSDARGLLVPRRSALPCGFRLAPPRQQQRQKKRQRVAGAGHVVTVTRVFDTCEPRDYRVQEGTVHVLYALLDEPIAREPWGSLNVTSLRARGVRLVRLLRDGGGAGGGAGVVVEGGAGGGAEGGAGGGPTQRPPAVVDVRAPNVTVPARETTYWCHVTEFPHVGSKQHIVKFEPLVTLGHEAMVHHMEVFQCPGAGAAPVTPFSGPCDDPRRPAGLDACRRVLAAWAMGAEPFTYPDEAGLPIGGPGSSPLLRLEIHYHNPGQLSGRVDSSGMRLHYTDHLRAHDAAVMELGLVYSARMAVPPAQRHFQLTGYCPPGCTRQALPRGGVRVFASQLHTHLAGVAVSTWLLRNGTGEPHVLNADPHFSASLQEIRPLTPPLLVLPGDLLVTTCTYNTEDRRSVTVGGLSIEEEMCVNYLHYFPASPLELCKSDVSSRPLAAFFSFLERSRGHCRTRSDDSVSERYSRVAWDRDASAALLLAALYAQAPIDLHCNTSARQRIPVPWREQPLPEWSPPPEPSRHCPASVDSSATAPPGSPRPLCAG